MKKMKLRWGVIGAGGIADRRTIPGMMEAENAELVAVMEVEQSLADSIKEKYGAKAAYDNADDLLARDDIDAVYIASPVICHEEAAVKAAEAGKHILIEKPIALTSAKAQEIIDYCDKKGIKVGAGFMMRFAAYHQLLKGEIKKLGQLTNAAGQFTCWYPDIEGAWRQIKSLGGGGALMDMGVHLIDLIQYITGEKIVSVAAFNDTMTFGYEVEDASAILGKLESGAYVNINSNFNIPDEAAKWRMEFYGTGGRIICDETIGQVEGGTVEALFTGEAKDYDAQQDKKSAGKTVYDVEFGNMYTKEIESFSDSVLNGKPLESPASEAIYVQKVIEAAYKSSEEKTFVDVI